MHHLAEALDRELIGHLNRGCPRDAADVVAAQIEQHQMLGAFLLIRQQFGFERLVLLERRAARPRAGEWANGHGALAHSHQDFRARANDREAAEVEEIKKGRWIDPPQRPVERKGRQFERRLETLRQHDLENVPGGDVLLGDTHHTLVFDGGNVGGWPHRERSRLEIGRSMRQWCIERIEDGREALARAREGRLGRDADFWAHRRDDGNHVFHGVEHDHDGGAHQHRVGNPDRVGVGLRQLLHQPHHVVAKVAENAGGHGRQHVRQLDPAFGDERAQRRQRRPVAGREAISPVPRRAADLGLPSHRAPNEIGIESDDRIAPAQRAALHRLQQKAERPRSRDLEEGRHRGLQIRDERGPHDLWLASRVALGKCHGLRLDLHGSQVSLLPRRRHR